MEPAAQSSRRDKSIGELLAELTTEVTDLVRDEIRLARIEISNNLSALQTAAISMLTGGTVAFGGFLVLLAAAVLGLNVWLQSAWLSALIVGAVVTAIGAGLCVAARSTLQRETLAPEKTARSLQKDKELAQRHI